jgi:U3 small nucleolar RNA-associated protein 10
MTRSRLPTPTSPRSTSWGWAVRAPTVATRACGGCDPRVLRRLLRAVPRGRALRSVRQVAVWQGRRGVQPRPAGAGCRSTAAGGWRPCAAEASARIARSAAQDADANARLDATLESYLRLLSAYFLLPAATRTLEYLIRRFKCGLRAGEAPCTHNAADWKLTALLRARTWRRLHTYNVDAAVACALPYHATPQFVRLVQVLQLEGTRWTFLSAVKTQGAPPTRAALVSCVARDNGLLALVGDLATAAAAGGARGSRVATTFYTLLLTEVVASMTRVPEERLPKLLPFIHTGLDKAASLDHHAGALIVITQLASRAQLTQPMVDALLVSVAKAARAPLESHTLRVALQLARTQTVPVLPHHAVTYLVKMPSLTELLGQLGRSCAAEALIRPLVTALAERLGTHQTYNDVLRAIVRDVPMQASAELLATKLFTAAGHSSAAAKQGEAEDAASADILQDLHRRFPVEVNAAAARTLRGMQTDTVRQQAFAAFLRRALLGTSAQPLQHHAAVTLGGGLEHDAPRIREAALRELAQLADSSQAAGAETAAVLQPGHLRNVLLQRICDDDNQVSIAALSLARLADLVSDDAALFTAAATCLSNAVDVLRLKGKGTGNLRAIAKRAFKLLAVTLPRRTPALRDAAARALLEYIVGGKDNLVVSQLARGFAPGLHALYGSLADTPDSDGEQEAQRRALAAMGDALGSAPDALLRWACASWPDLQAGGKLTLLSVLLRALHSASDAGHLEALAGAAWEFLAEEPSAIRLRDDAGSAAWSEGLPPAEYLTAWDPRDPSCVALLRRQLLLAAIPLLPASPDEEHGKPGVLCQVFALLCDSAGMEEHMQAVLARANTVYASSTRMLCLLASAPPEVVSEMAQTSALKLLHGQFDSDAFPHLLVALASSRRAVRTAAVGALSAVAGTSAPARSAAQAKRGAPAQRLDVLEVLEPWIREHGAALASGSTSLLLALRAALRDATSAPLRRLLFDFLGSNVQPHASLHIVLALRESGSEHATALAVLPVWHTLCQRAPLSAYELQVADAIASILVAGAVASEGETSNARTALIAALSGVAAPQIQLAAMNGITAAAYAAMSASEQDSVLAHSLLTMSRGELHECREAARGLVCRLPVGADAFGRLLCSACAAVQGGVLGQGPAVKKRQALRQERSQWAVADAEPLEVCTATLEAVCWKHMDHSAPLLAPICEIACKLLDMFAQPDVERPAALGAAEVESGDAESSGRPALEYRIQLALSALTTLVRSSGAGCAVQISVPVRALRQVPDAGVHEAALELLAAAASVAPERVVTDVLDITRALTTQAGMVADDRTTGRALHEAFGAVAACWVVARSDDGAGLLEHVMAALPSVQEHQRLPLLSALLRSLPSPFALTRTLELLVADTDSLGQPASSSLHALAVTLCSLRPQLECMQALCGVLERAAVSDGAVLLRKAAFVTDQLRAPGLLAWVARQKRSPQLQSSLSEMVAHAVSFLARTGAVDAPGADGQRIREGMQVLLAAVESTMEPLPFLHAITKLVSNEDQLVQRRALRIFLAHVRRAEPASVSSSAEHAALITPLAALIRKSEKAALSTRCAALAVLTALIERFGASDEFAAQLLPELPDVLAAAGHRRPMVAARGLECIAAAVTTLSTRMVPLLPALVPAVLAVLEAGEQEAPRVCGALAALTAIIVRMDAFLSPFAHRLVALLLTRQLVTSESGDVLQAAAAARAALAARLPARILIEPLTAAWDAVLEAGPEPAVALLQQLTELVQVMDTGATAALHDTVFGACGVIVGLSCCARLLTCAPLPHSILVALLGHAENAAGRLAGVPRSR